MTEMVQTRDLNQIAAEIRYLDANAKRIVLGHAIEIGNRLIEAKELVPYGTWGEWLKENLSYSQSSANNFMRIATEYGATQMGLFGPEAKSETLGNLPYTKALKLLAIPEDEREEFVSANNVESMSTRELDQAIKERNEAREKLEAAEKAAAEAAETEADLRAEIKELQSRPVEVAVQVDQKAIDDAVKAAKAEAEINMSKAKEEARSAQSSASAWQKEADTAKKAQKSAETKLKEAETRIAAAEAQLEQAKKAGSGETDAMKVELAEARAETEMLRKKLSMSDTGVSAFRALFMAVQEQIVNLISHLKDIEDDEARAKCKGAVKAMLDQIGEDL